MYRLSRSSPSAARDCHVGWGSTFAVRDRSGFAFGLDATRHEDTDDTAEYGVTLPSLTRWRECGRRNSFPAPAPWPPGRAVPRAVPGAAAALAG